MCKMFVVWVYTYYVSFLFYISINLIPVQVMPDPLLSDRQGASAIDHIIESLAKVKQLKEIFFGTVSQNLIDTVLDKLPNILKLGVENIGYMEAAEFSRWVILHVLQRIHCCLISSYHHFYIEPLWCNTLQREAKYKGWAVCIDLRGYAKRTCHQCCYNIKICFLLVLMQLLKQQQQQKRTHQQ